MKKRLFWTKTEEIEVLENSLCSGKISICTTDTVLGFLCPLFEKSFKQLCSIKKRSLDKPFIVLISNCNKLGSFVNIQDTHFKAIKFAQACWPSTVTMIFKAKKELPDFMVDNRGTIALRCPQHPELRDLLSNFDGLFSTSLNEQGVQTYQSTDYIEDKILEKIEYIVLDEKTSENKTLSASSIVEFVVNEKENLELNILRSGSVPAAKLKEIYEQI
jgi:L-threonylcarbamoyladenylate synthase